MIYSEYQNQLRNGHYLIKITPPPVGTSPEIRGGRFLRKEQQSYKFVQSTPSLFFQGGLGWVNELKELFNYS